MPGVLASCLLTFTITNTNSQDIFNAEYLNSNESNIKQAWPLAPLAPPLWFEVLGAKPATLPLIEAFWQRRGKRCCAASLAETQLPFLPLPGVFDSVFTPC
jgi:hypothetical protein